MLRLKQVASQMVSPLPGAISHTLMLVGGKKIQKELIWEQKFSKLVMEGWACKFYNVLLLLYDYLSTFIRHSHSDWHKRGWFLHLDYLFRLWSCWIHFDPIFNLIQQSGRGTDEWKWKLWNSTGNPNLDFIIFVIECKIKICQEVSDLIGPCNRSSWPDIVCPVGG